MTRQAQVDARRDAILVFIEEFWAEHHYGPTYQEIANGVGMRSASGLMQQIRVLHEAGCVTLAPGKTRTIRVVEP